LRRAGNVETPTIFLGGRIDWNVLVLTAELFHQALKVQGIETELVVYPDVPHGGWPEEFEKDYLVRVVTWFDGFWRAIRSKRSASEKNQWISASHNVASARSTSRP
jgi:acetyl esterase/lipase